MIIKIRKKSLWTSHEKNIFISKNNLEHICAHKYLLSIYIIHNYTIYRFVSCVLHFRDFTYLCVRVRIISASVSVSVLHRSWLIQFVIRLISSRSIDDVKCGSSFSPDRYNLLLKWLIQLWRSIHCSKKIKPVWCFLLKLKLVIYKFVYFQFSFC